MVKSHIWSILSWSKVGSFIKKIDRIYGQSLIWSILGGQNRGPYGRYTLYWSIVRPLDISSSDFITSSVLTSHRYYCSFAAIPLQKIPIYLLTGQNPNALSTAAINPTFVGGMELLSSTSSECAQPQVRRRKLFIQFWICEEGGRGEEGSDAIGGTIC